MLKNCLDIKSKEKSHKKGQLLRSILGDKINSKGFKSNWFMNLYAKKSSLYVHSILKETVYLYLSNP